MSYKKINEFDVIIIGAGLSGLTLAKEISEKTQKTILIIEKEKSLNQEKNWCFWNTPKNYFTDLHDTSWEKISIKIHNEELILENVKIKYLHINSLTFFNYMLKDLKRKKVNFLFNNNIKEIYQNNLKNFVKTKMKYTNQKYFLIVDLIC